MAPLTCGHRRECAADALAKSAHSQDGPFPTAVLRIDEVHIATVDELRKLHPDARVPTQKLSRQNSCRVPSRLCTGCAPVPPSQEPGLPPLQSVRHCISHLSAYNCERARLCLAYGQVGAPCSAEADILFPRCQHSLKRTPGRTPVERPPPDGSSRTAEQALREHSDPCTPSRRSAPANCCPRFA